MCDFAQEDPSQELARSNRELRAQVDRLENAHRAAKKKAEKTKAQLEQQLEDNQFLQALNSNILSDQKPQPQGPTPPSKKEQRARLKQSQKHSRLLEEKDSRIAHLQKQIRDLMQKFEGGS